jgi:hypothetical protein
MGDALGDSIGPSITTALMSAGALAAWPAIAAIVACGALGSGAVARSAAHATRRREPEPALG